MLTFDQTGPIIGAILGGGGVSGIVIAVLSSWTAARAGRKPAEAPTITITGDHVGVQWDRSAANHLGTVAYALTRLVAIQEVRTRHDLRDTDFADRLEARVDRLTIEAVKAWAEAP